MAKHHDVEHKDAFGNVIKLGDIVIVHGHQNMIKAKVVRFLPTKLECKYKFIAYNGKDIIIKAFWKPYQIAIIDKLDSELVFSDEVKETVEEKPKFIED